MKKTPKIRSLTETEKSRLDQAMARRAAAESNRLVDLVWVLEFLPNVKRPTDDPLRTWLVHVLLRSRKAWKTFEDHVSNRWADGIVQEFWSFPHATEELNRLCGALEKCRYGRDSLTIPGMGPMENQVQADNFVKELAIFRKKVLAELEDAEGVLKEDKELDND